MNVADFHEALWGRRLPAGTFIQCWELDRRRSRYFRAPAGTAYLNGAVDTYTAVALTAVDYGPRRRARADQAVAIPGLWLDIDVDGGPERKTGAAPDELAAVELALTILAPTLVVNSGHGRQAWWLFAGGPWRFASRAEQQQAALMAAQWHRLHQTAAREQGYSIDAVHDLARLMRPPGTINGKGGQRAPVELVSEGPRYTRDTLTDACAQAGPVALHTPGDEQPGAERRVDIVARDAAVDHALLEALLANSPEFAAAWRHQRKTGWSLSEYDLSIASLAAQAGWTDQQLADLITLHRRLWDTVDAKAPRLRDLADTKARRIKYLRDTVFKAREQGTARAAIARLTQGANTRRAA